MYIKVFQEVKSIETVLVAEPPSIQATIGDAKWQYVECVPHMVNVITISPSKPVSGFLENLVFGEMYTGFPG